MLVDELALDADDAVVCTATPGGLAEDGPRAAVLVLVAVAAAAPEALLLLTAPVAAAPEAAAEGTVREVGAVVAVDTGRLAAVSKTVGSFPLAVTSLP